MDRITETCRFAKIIRRRTLVLYAPLLLLFTTACTQQEFRQIVATESTVGRPNILWISLEDVGTQIGAYGDRDADTPNIDNLAAAGITYENAYSVAGVCAPSRSAVITGLYPTSLGSQHMRSRAHLPPGIEILPHYLQLGGYYTSNNSKTDYNFSHRAESWNESSDRAHWRNRQDPGQPFFSVFNFMTTHESRVRKSGLYRKATRQLDEGRRKIPQALVLPPYYPDTPRVRQSWKRYYDIISAVDGQVGELLEQLRADGLADDTIVVFWSDHGAGLPRAKRWIYDSGIRVPLIVHIPRKFRLAGQGVEGSRTDELVSLLDLAPTMLNLAGVGIPDHMQGRAFLGRDLSPPRAFVAAARDRMDERYDIVRAVRDKRYKYIRNYQPDNAYYQYMNTPEQGAVMQELRRLNLQELPAAARLYMTGPKPVEELYDTRTDPHEISNLSGSPAHQEVLNRLRRAHYDWRLRTLDTGLLPEAHMRELEHRFNRSIYTLVRSQQVSLQAVFAAADKSLIAGNDRRQVVSGLTHENPAVRYWALQAVRSRFAPGEGRREILEPMLEDTDGSVQILAAELLARENKPERSLEVLTGHLAGGDEWLRLQAAVSLERTGEAGLAVVDQLRAALADSNKYVVRVVNRHLNLLFSENNRVK